MMEPISVAVAAFGAIKAGVSAGKELHSLGKQVGQLFDAIDEVKGAHTKKKSSIFASANEEALETFMAKQQAQDMEEQLRTIIIQTRGISAWQELLHMRREIRQRRKEEEAERLAQRKELMETIAWVAGGIVIIGLAFGTLYLLYLRSRGEI